MAARLRWFIAAVWAVFLATVVWLADTHRARWLFNWVERTPGADKAGHFILVGLFAYCLNLALRGRAILLGPLKVQIGSVIVLVIFTVEECSQLWITWRSFDWSDLAANALGVLVFDRLSLLRLRRRAGNAPQPVPD